VVLLFGITSASVHLVLLLFAGRIPDFVHEIQRPIGCWQTQILGVGLFQDQRVLRLWVGGPGAAFPLPQACRDLSPAVDQLLKDRVREEYGAVRLRPAGSYEAGLPNGRGD
jgi:hypothetical protein